MCRLPQRNTSERDLWPTGTLHFPEGWEVKTRNAQRLGNGDNPSLIQNNCGCPSHGRMRTGPKVRSRLFLRSLLQFIRGIHDLRTSQRLLFSYHHLEDYVSPYGFQNGTNTHSQGRIQSLSMSTTTLESRVITEHRCTTHSTYISSNKYMTMRPMA